MGGCDVYRFGAFLFHVLLCCQWHFVYAVGETAPNIVDHPNWGLLDHSSCGIGAGIDRIIGGTNATLGQFPWLARVGYSFRGFPDLGVMFRCGASLINKNYVLTAAHCIPDKKIVIYPTQIRLGEHDAGSEIDCEREQCAAPVQDFGIEKIIVHEEYGKPHLHKNDIALIRLDHSAVYNGWVKPICLPRGPQLTKDYVGTTAQVAGWGIYDMQNPVPSSFLLHVSLPVVELLQCAFAFRKFTRVSGSQLCGGGVEDKDSCAGDSGGPLVRVESLDGTARYYQLGLVSFGAKKCGKKGVPAVYTNVARYMGWILDHLKE